MTDDIGQNDIGDLPEKRALEARAIVNGAIESAQNYDGSEVSYERVFDALIAFENCAKELFGDPKLNYDQREAALAQRVIKTPVTTQELLGVAARNFGQRLKAGSHNIKTIETGFIFLPTESAAPVSSGHHVGLSPALSEPRTEKLITLLNSHKPPIFTDDLIMYPGKVSTNMIRHASYTLIQIPRLDREIVISDQVGEACYVGQGQRGPLFWTTYRKPELNQVDGISRILYNEKYEENLIEVLFGDNVIKPKVPIRTPSYFPLSADIVLNKALEQAAANKGVLPSEHSGAVIGLPGQTWEAWTMAMRLKIREFDLDGIRGVGHLYNLFGLKIGRSENPEVVSKALKSLEETGQHGLQRQDDIKLTSDFILTKALEHAGANGGELPTSNSGDVMGMPGQTWRVWNAAISQKLRGFDLDGVKGLRGLYNRFGLKIGKSDNPEIIQQAITNLKETKTHGLKPQDTIQLTADFILTKAIEHAGANKGLLPVRESGAVIGLPGQTWAGWHAAIAKKIRGFDLDEIKGLQELYNLYGLKIGKSENPQVVQQAILNLKETGQHGLKPQSFVKLTADFILTKALEHAAINQGRLPSQDSGEVTGMPGQTWVAWNLAIRKQSRGFDIDGLKGLNNLYNIYGLKTGLAENGNVIEQALKNMKETGHHGLQGQGITPTRQTPQKSPPGSDYPPG